MRQQKYDYKLQGGLMSNIYKKSMQDRVDAAIEAGELDDEFLREYLSRLITLVQETTRSMMRGLALAVVAMALFILLAGKEVKEVTVVSFKISSVSFVELVIPVFVACIVLRVFALSIETRVIG